MRVLCIAPYVPFPGVRHAGGAYIGRFLEELAITESVTLVAPDTPDNRTAAQDPHAYEVQLIELAKDPLGRAGTRVRNARLALSPGWPALEGLRLSPALRDLAAQADVIDLEYGHLLPLVPLLRRWTAAAVVATEHDVVAQTFLRRANRASRPERVALDLQGRRVARREIELLNQCDAVRTLSAKDAELLRDLGLRVEAFQTELVGGGTSRGIAGRPGPVLFTGAMWREENTRSISWFVEQAWPGVRASQPDAELRIVGADPDASTLAFDGRDGVTVTGWVDDLSVEYERAGVFVAPIVAGAGVKAKVFEAMRWTLPIVATTIGAEGIAEVTPSGCFADITDLPDQFARAVSTLLDDAQVRATIGNKAARWVESLPSFKESVAASVAVFAELAQRRRVR